MLLPYLANAQNQPTTDPVALLHAVAAAYAMDTDTFDMESVEERVRTSDFEHSWTKTYRRATRGPGAFYRIESHDPYATYLQDSDGEHEWTYFKEANLFTVRPALLTGPAMPKISFMGSGETSTAWNMRKSLEAEAREYSHAVMKAPETIRVAGHSFECYVVYVTNQDKDNAQQRSIPSATTYWIDKKTFVFRKIVLHTAGRLYLPNGLTIPYPEEVTTTYPIVDLHAKVNARLFTFRPPADAKQIASFEPEDHSATSASTPGSAVRFMGKPAPDISLTSEDGKTVPLHNFRGKPVLLDLWATWCGPCLLAMPGINRLHEQFGDRLALITVDQDGHPPDATNYLARHGYAWRNFHDEKSALSNALDGGTIPVTILIDAQGTIRHYGIGSSEEELRKAIETLVPEPRSTK